LKKEIVKDIRVTNLKWFANVVVCYQCMNIVNVA